MMQKYEIIIYWSNEDRVFIAEVPELPGCIAHGETQEAALQNVKEAMQLWIDTALEAWPKTSFGSLPATRCSEKLTTLTTTSSGQQACGQDFSAAFLGCGDPVPEPKGERLMLA